MVPTWAESSSRRLLTRLRHQIGRPTPLPGLTAAVDQHAAAVRDILAVGVQGSAAGVVLLAGYARGLLDGAREQGWYPRRQTDWARADWITTRLLAVCALAAQAE
jgi:hypothetical protein